MALDWRNPTGTALSLYGKHVLAGARNEPERSGIVNSLAAQEFGSDATEPYDLRAIGADLSLPAAGLRWTIDLAQEDQRAVSVHARPALGSFAPTIAAVRYSPLHLSLQLAREVPVTWGPLHATASARLDQWHQTAAQTCRRSPDVCSHRATRGGRRSSPTPRQSLGPVAVW